MSEIKENSKKYLLRDIVVVGDVALLKSGNLNVGGFVSEIYSDRIRLSHEDPNSPEKLKWDSIIRKNDFVFGSGDKCYYLHGFDRYEILKKASQIRADSSNENERDIKDLLEDVIIGDFILLKLERIRVSGFVLNKDSGSVKISHEDPNSFVKRAWGEDRRSTVGKGDRSYCLNHFQSYEILKRSLELKREIREESDLGENDS